MCPPPREDTPTGACLGPIRATSAPYAEQARAPTIATAARESKRYSDEMDFGRRDLFTAALTSLPSPRSFGSASLMSTSTPGR